MRAERIDEFFPRAGRNRPFGQDLHRGTEADNRSSSADELFYKFSDIFAALGVGFDEMPVPTPSQFSIVVF